MTKFNFIVLATVFASAKSSTSNRTVVEIDLIDSQLQLFEDVIVFIGAMSEDVRYFIERITLKSITSMEVKRSEEVAEKFKSFKHTMNNLVIKNNIFLRNLFAAAYPDKMEKGIPQDNIKLGQILLLHKVEIKKLFAHHLNQEGMQLWKLLGLNLERDNMIQS